MPSALEVASVQRGIEGRRFVPIRSEEATASDVVVQHVLTVWAWTTGCDERRTLDGQDRIRTQNEVDESLRFLNRLHYQQLMENWHILAKRSSTLIRPLRNNAHSTS